MKKNRKQIWVHPEFAKKLKHLATNQNVSMMRLTKELSDCKEEMMKKTNGKYKFKI